MFLKELNFNLERIATALEKLAEIKYEPNEPNSKLEFETLSSSATERERREERESRRERLEKKLSKSNTFFKEDGVPLEDFIDADVVDIIGEKFLEEEI